MAEAKTYLDLSIDKAALRRDLADALALIKQTFAGAKFPVGGSGSGKAPPIPGMPPAEAVKKAAEAIAAMDKRLADVRVKYSKDAGKQIVSDLKHLQDESAKLRNAEIASVDKAVKAEIKLKRQAIDEEKRLLTQVAKDKQAVQKQGVGAPAGILGTGRNLIGGIPGVAGGLGKIAGAVGIGAAMKEVIDVGRTYESSLAELSALTGVTGDKLKEIGNNARGLGKTFGVDASQGVESYKLALSSLGPGLASDTKALAEFGRLGTTLSKATGDDLGTSMTAIVGVMNQAGLATGSYAEQARQAGFVTNTLAAAAKVGNAEVPDLSEGFKAVGKTATDAGLDVTRTAAALETLASFEIKGAEGGTQLRNIMLKMSAGTKESQDALKSMGLTYADINPRAVGFEKGLETLRAGFERIKDPVQKAAAMKHLFGLETSTAAGALLSSTEKLRDYTKEISKAAADKEAEKQAATRMATFDGQLSRFIANLKDVGITVFTAMQPALTAIFDIVGKLAPVFTAVGDVLGRTMAAIMPTVTRLVEILVTGLGPILESVGSLMVPLGNAIGQILAPVLDAIAGIMPTVVELFTMLSGALQPVIAAIGEMLSGQAAMLADLFRQLVVTAAPLIGSLVKLGLSFVPILIKTDVMVPLMMAFTTILKLTLQAVSPLVQGLAWLVGKIADGVAWVGKLMPSLFTLKDRAIAPLSGAVGLLGRGMSSAWGVVMSGVSAVTNLFAPLWRATAATASWITNLLGLSGVFRTVLGWIGSFTSAIGDAVGQIARFLGIAGGAKPGGGGSWWAGAAARATAGPNPFASAAGGMGGAGMGGAGATPTAIPSLPAGAGGGAGGGGGRGHGGGGGGRSGKSGKSAEEKRKEEYDKALAQLEAALKAEQHLIETALLRGEITDEQAKQKKLTLEIRYDRLRLQAAIRFRQDYAEILRDAEIHDLNELDARRKRAAERVQDERDTADLLRDIAEQNADATAELGKKEIERIRENDARIEAEKIAFAERLAKRRDSVTAADNSAREAAIKAEQARRDRVAQLEAAGQRVPDNLRKPIPIPVELRSQRGGDLQDAILDAVNAADSGIRGPINAVANAFNPIFDHLGAVGSTFKTIFGGAAQVVGNFATQFTTEWGRIATDFVAAKQKMIVAWLAEKAQAGLTAAAVWAYEGLKSSAFVQSAAAATVAAGEWIAAQASVAASAVASAAVWVGAQLAAAASSIGSAVASVISWIAQLIPWPLSLALIPAGIAGIYGLWQGAQSLFAPKKFAEGGIVNKPLFSPFMGGAVAGEAGPEAILPLSALGKIIGQGIREAFTDVTDVTLGMGMVRGGKPGTRGGFIDVTDVILGMGMVVPDGVARGGLLRANVEAARDMADIRQALQSPQFVTVLDQNRNILSMKRTEQLNNQGVL